MAENDNMMAYSAPVASVIAYDADVESDGAIMGDIKGPGLYLRIVSKDDATVSHIVRSMTRVEDETTYVIAADVDNEDMSFEYQSDTDKIDIGSEGVYGREPRTDPYIVADMWNVAKVLHSGVNDIDDNLIDNISQTAGIHKIMAPRVDITGDDIGLNAIGVHIVTTEGRDSSIIITAGDTLTMGSATNDIHVVSENIHLEPNAPKGDISIQSDTDISIDAPYVGIKGGHVPYVIGRMYFHRDVEGRYGASFEDGYILNEDNTGRYSISHDGDGAYNVLFNYNESIFIPNNIFAVCDSVSSPIFSYCAMCLTGHRCQFKLWSPNISGAVSAHMLILGYDVK